MLFLGDFKKKARAFEGNLILYDLLDNKIATISLKNQDIVTPNTSFFWNGEIRYNQFIGWHKSLKNTPKKNLKVKFILKKILYVDGRQDIY